MKILRVISVISLVIAIFISIDLGVNCLGSLVPEMQDGIGYNSVLQKYFGILEGSLMNRESFFDAFKTSIWVTFYIFLANALLQILAIIKQKKYN